ncbi:putative HTH-type transcriptional regulator YdfH [Moorella humiferrea]|uniref:Putative HTH-type transcriptional regulator YdfH n=2 Tax=Neomoorella humiferrea TaxID=676965 RepID=A0A2T0AMB3_9FIRM|nr:putative HTH-type transcriptional regulator YdfH [Moorella humiferrea]
METLRGLDVIQPVMGQKVYEQIKEAIINNTIKPGTMIQERILAEKLGVSRTPVREALRRLNSEGLIELIPGKGATVTKITIEDIREIMQVREPLECLAVKLAAERIQPQDIKYLEEMIANWDKEINCTDPAQINFQSLSTKDIAFHEYIVEIAGNKRLASILNMLRDQIRRITFLTQDNKNRIETSFPQHLKILEALKQRDPAAAEENMRQHMQSIKEYYYDWFGFKEANL